MSVVFSDQLPFLKSNILSFAMGLVTLCSLEVAFADTIADLNQQQNLSEQRLFEQMQQQNKQRDQDNFATLQHSIDKQKVILKPEQPCFLIQQIKLDVDEKEYRHFYFLQHQLNQPKTGIIGQCVGHAGLQQILIFSQNLLLDKGYVTSRVLLRNQDLNSGDLVLSIIPGKVANIYREPDDIHVNFLNALTVKQGDVLNVRELEQSIENLTLPGNVTAKIYIEPSKQTNNDENIGLTDLIVRRQKTNKLSLQAIFNNFGNYSTGKYQAGMGLIVNEPLLSNDRFYVQYMSSLNGINNTDRPATNENIYLNYQYPLRSWKLGLTYNHSRYTQALKGWNSDPMYKGVSERKQFQLSKMLYRTANTKLSTYGAITRKKSDYFIDDLEILVQKRRTTNYALGLDFELIRTNKHQFNFDISMNKGSGAFRALPVPEQFYSHVDSRPLIWLIDSNYRLPFQIGQHQFGYNIHLNAQYSQDHLAPNDQFIIGDRYAVRGFDGKRLLAGNKGGVIGQEVYYKLPTQNPHQIYLAVDSGFVSRDGLSTSGYDHAIGGVLGYRFGTKHLNFDAYIGQPIQGQNLSTKTNAGVQVAFVY